MSLTLTEIQTAALIARIARLNSLADRALENNNDAKAERLTDKADALDMALNAVQWGNGDAHDIACIAEALRREIEIGNLAA